MRAAAFALFTLMLPFGQPLGAADPMPATDDPVALAEAEFRRGDYAKAEAILKAEVARCEGLKDGQIDLADALCHLGRVQSFWEKNADALESTKKALAIAKAHFGEKHHFVYAIKQNTGQMYTSLGRYQEAEKWYADCFHNYSSAPRDPAELLRMAAVLYLAAGCLDDALLSCTHAVDLLALDKPVRDREWYYAQRTLGMIYLAKNDPRRAKECFDRVKNSWFAKDMHQEIGEYHLVAGEYAEAIKVFQAEIETRSKNRERYAHNFAEATYWLGRAQVQSGDKAAGRKSLGEALAFYEKRTQMDPNLVGRILDVYAEHFPDLMDAKLKAKRDEIRAFRDANKPAGYAKTFATAK